MPLVFFAASYSNPAPFAPPFFSRFHSLRIDDRSGWACLAALHLAHLHKQQGVDAPQYTVARPFPKIIVDGGARWKNLSATAATGILFLQHSTHRAFMTSRMSVSAMPATRPLRRDQGRNDRPFQICHIARITFSARRRMLDAGCFFGSHLAASDRRFGCHRQNHNRFRKLKNFQNRLLA